MKKNICTSILLLALFITAKTQSNMDAGKTGSNTTQSSISKDTTSLLHAFKAGNFQGHLRYFFMSTQNENGLNDYYAHAVGGGLKYETATFHGFQLAISGFEIFNAGSSDFSKPDSVTGQYNRYETALYDVQQPASKRNLNRFEELYLKYNYKKSKIIAGRQFINTPFINLQDGRMRPTVVQGIWLEINELKNTKIEGGWLNAISPRGTVKWYNMGESIGLYPAGANPDGSKSNYSNNVASNGVAMLGISTKIKNHIKLQVWNMFAENVLNTAMLQADYTYEIKVGSTLLAAAQFIRQDAVGDGGNSNPSKTYFPKGQKAMSFGVRMGWKNKVWETTINYNRITADGRYLVPREWGIEPFFTFLPRERNDGAGNVDAVMAKVNYNIHKSRIKTSLAAGYYRLPDVKNYPLNKFGFPSYTQLNADARYSFAGLLKGLDVQLLVVAKLREGNTYDNAKFVFNKVNMVQYNLVFNYHFLN